jgi:tetratricopeptide (TPR) repeat protein
MRYHHYNTDISVETHQKATTVLEYAVKRDPEYALGIAQLAFLYCDAYALDMPVPLNPLEQAVGYARRAVRLDSQCQEARAALATVLFHSRQHREAIREASASIALNPNSAYHVGYAGWLMGLCGEVERGSRIIDETESLNPYRPGWLRAVPLLRLVDMGHHAQAAREALRISMPELPWDPMFRAWTASLAGDRAAARAAWEELSEKHAETAADPEPTIRKFLHFDRWVDSMLTELGSLRELSALT